MFRRSCVVVILVLLGFMSGTVAAQEATPTGEFITPDPAECTVQPRTVDELMRFLATPAGAAQATPDILLSEGEPADAEVAAEVTATTRELYACYNANAFLQVFALFTDDYLARSMSSEGIAPEAIGLFATPIAAQAADERISIAVRDVQLLPDGRVGATVISRSPLGDGAESPSTYIFVERDGRWLVDDMILDPTDAD